MSERIPLNVLVGVPDDMSGEVSVAPDGRSLLRYDEIDDRATAQRYLSVALDSEPVTLLGSACLLAYLSPERFALHRFFLQKGAQCRMTIGEGAILNHIGDPDICSGALELASRLVSTASRPCFNQPAAVARTTRDGIARLLTGIPGLRVPKTIRVVAPTPSRVRDAVRENGLEYPILLREIGAHGAVVLGRVNEPGALESARRSRGLYVTEFCDFKGSDGRYRKFRIVVVGDAILLRHCMIGDKWLLNISRRAPATEQSERAMFAAFDRDWSKHLQPIFRDISARLGLDYYGVDCNIDDNGQVLLFEANACMNVLKNTTPSPNMWDAPIERIKWTLEQRLASPSTWRPPAA